MIPKAPILRWLPKYTLKSLPHDVIASLTLTTIVIPQSLAYALMAGVPPIYGLYTSILPVLIYACLGTSRHLSIGTFSLVSLVLKTGVDGILRLNPGADHISVVMLLTFLSSSLQIIASFLNAGGAVLHVLPGCLVSGLTTAAAFQIATSQLQYLFGYRSVPSFSGFVSVFRICANVIINLPNANWICFGLGIGTIALIYLFRWINTFKLPVKLPDVLLPAVIATIITASLRLDLRGVQVIGDIPSGFPFPQFPFAPCQNAELKCNLVSILFSSIQPTITIAMISFILTAAILKLYAKTEKLDLNQDLFALGVSGLLGSLLGNAYVPSGSLSRTSIIVESGGKTQLTSLFSGLLVLLSLFAVSALRYVSYAVLSAIVLVSIVKLLFQVSEGWRLVYSGWSKTTTELLRVRVEASLWWITFLSVLILGLDYGLVVGVACSIIVLIYDSRPKWIELGKCAGYTVSDDDGNESSDDLVKDEQVLFYTSLKPSNLLNNRTIQYVSDIPKAHRVTKTDCEIRQGPVERVDGLVIYSLSLPRILRRQWIVEDMIFKLLDREQSETVVLDICNCGTVTTDLLNPIKEYASSDGVELRFVVGGEFESIHLACSLVDSDVAILSCEKMTKL